MAEKEKEEKGKEEKEEENKNKNENENGNKNKNREKPPEGLSKEELKEWARKKAEERRKLREAKKGEETKEKKTETKTETETKKEKKIYTNPLADRLRERFKEELSDISVDDPLRVSAFVDPSKVKEVMKILKEEFGLDHLMDVSGVDALKLQGADPNTFWVVYHLTSYDNPTILTLKAVIPRDNPQIDSIIDIYWNANWYERETFELFGIVFNGHPKLKALFLEDEDIGQWPLRKDSPAYPNPNNTQR